MQMLGALVNLLLILACIYAMYSLKPEDHPYGYMMVSFSLVHGLLTLVLYYNEDTEDEPVECGRCFQISNSILEVIPLPMANIEFYLLSDESEVAQVHGLSLIPLFYDIIGKVVDDWNTSTETLKDIALLFNIASTMYLTIKDGNHIYGAVAATALMARFGTSLVDRFAEGYGTYLATLGHAGIVALMTYALTEA
ncbi:uncharacterized protein LOC108104998 [Drosophila eugracilis]|uniref:uncharacterized protein LOC108104998 n=1 Tax=Drosophila eugracilis TaxID=29029 RepID=UPI0007E5DF90|nr:uncharacterized protein LOC108104998 [Drosophila eugracilis]